MPDERMHVTAVHTALKTPRVQAMVLVSCLGLILFTAFEYAFPELVRGERVMKDYDAFFVAGRMFWAGRLEDAYFAKSLIAAQAEIVGAQSFMPWTYPPHFNAVTALLALMPVWLGYTIFTSITFCFYLAMLRRLASHLFIVVLIFTFPAATICIRTGQNGFLIAGLMAYFISSLQHRNVRAGFSLALLSIKPHFLPLAYLLAALRGQWNVVLGGLACTALLLSLSTGLFGFGIWPAFQNAILEAGAFLRGGVYPLFRMTSLYAALHTLGVPPNIALTAQMALGLIGVGTVFVAKIRLWPRNQLLATAVMASLFISPYAYDYDLQILGVALALLMPDLWAKASTKQVLVLLVGCWLASVFGFFGPSEEGTPLELRSDHPALNFWFLLPVCIYSLLLARNGPKTE